MLPLIDMMLNIMLQSVDEMYMYTVNRTAIHSMLDTHITMPCTEI